MIICRDMLFKKNLKFVVAIFGLSAMVLPFVSSAAIVPCDKCGLCDFFLLIKNIFNFIAFTLAPPVAAFLFLLAGFLFLISGGSEDRVSQAKKIFINAFIGLFIIYASWLIVNTIILTVGKDVEGLKINSWNTFECTK